MATSMRWCSGAAWLKTANSIQVDSVDQRKSFNRLDQLTDNVRMGRAQICIVGDNDVWLDRLGWLTEDADLGDVVSYTHPLDAQCCPRRSPARRWRCVCATSFAWPRRPPPPPSRPAAPKCGTPRRMSSSGCWPCAMKTPASTPSAWRSRAKRGTRCVATPPSATSCCAIRHRRSCSWAPRSRCRTTSAGMARAIRWVCAPLPN